MSLLASLGQDFTHKSQSHAHAANQIWTPQLIYSYGVPQVHSNTFFLPPREPHNRSQAGQRHREHTPHLVTSNTSSDDPATYLTSSPVLPLFCFSLVLCLSLSYDLICIFIRGTEPP